MLRPLTVLKPTATISAVILAAVRWRVVSIPPARSVYSLALLLLTLAATACERSTTIVLVRHAEPVAGPGAGNDPGLSDAGRARADSLVSVVEQAGLVAIIHTQFRRTSETAERVATPLGIPTTEIPFTPGQEQQHAADVTAHILNTHAGRNVLVVGHSNTVPLIAEQLGVTSPPTIGNTEFNRLFVIVKPRGSPGRLILGRYEP